MAKDTCQLEVYYIDYNKDEKEQKKDTLKKALKIGGHLLLNPIGIPYLAYKGAKAAKETNNASIVRKIDDKEVLSSFVNAQGNEWVESNDLFCQYYIRHPKTARSNILIEASDFNKFVYDEYCSELINYCCSHCNARKISITNRKLTKGNVGGTYKAVSANLGGDVESGEVFTIDSPNGVQKKEPLSEYIWIEKRLMLAIDSVQAGGSILLKDIKDFSFGLTVDLLKVFGANLEFAHSYEFTISIET